MCVYGGEGRGGWDKMPNVQYFGSRVGKGSRGPLQTFASSLVFNPPLYPHPLLRLVVVKS